MNMLDWIILGLLFGSLILGFKRGLVWQIINLAGFFAAYFVAYRYFGDVAPLLSNWLPFPDFSENVYLSMLTDSMPLQKMFYSAIAFGLLFFGTKLLLNVAGHFFHGFASLPVLSFFNRWLGAALCLVEVLLLVIILVNIAALLPTDMVRQSLDQSRISQYILKQSPVLTEQLQELWKEYRDENPIDKKEGVVS